MDPSKLDEAIDAAISAVEEAKPNDRSERDRWSQIVITKLQEVRALVAYYQIG